MKVSSFRVKTVSFVFGIVVLFTGVLFGQSESDDSVTYSSDVAVILKERCQDCHHPDGIAPFALMTYRQAKAWSPMIREVVTERRMPPWHADPKFGHFMNDRRMPDAEIAVLLKWMDTGLAEGNPAEMPVPREWNSDWRIGTPDAILELPQEMHIAPAGVIPYMDIEIPTKFSEDKWLRAIEIQPGNPKVVHHIILYAHDPNHQPTELDSFILGRRGFIAGFAAGTEPIQLPEGHAIKLPKNSTLQFEMHYTPTGKPETDRSRIGLRFAEGPPEHEVLTAFTVNTEFLIPAQANNYRVEADITFPENAILRSLTPHMHYRGKSFDYIAQYPDGKEETLLRVPRYDFNWQTTYTLVQPKFIPKGTVMHTVAHFDNSAENPSNPEPNKAVRWGQQTWEEMVVGFMSLSWFDGTEAEYLASLELRNPTELAKEVGRED